MISQEKIKRFLSLPVVTVIVVVTAILSRSLIQFCFLDIDNDKSYQILAAQNFLNGNCFSLLEAYANDLSSSAFVPLNKWPPGYSFFLSPFLLLFNNDVIVACLLLDLITSILFVLFARKLLFYCNIPTWLVNIYTLFCGFFFYSFCTTSSSDFITLTIFIIALYYTLNVFQKNSLRVLQLVVASLLFFLTVLTRYMYIPVALIVPSCLILISFFNKNKLLFKKGIIILGLTSFLIITFLLLQYHYTESAVYIRDAQKGFYVSNLKKFHPIFLSAFFNIDFATTTLSNTTGISFGSISRILSVLHFVIMLIAIALSIKWLITRRMNFTTNREIYFSLGIIISLLIIVSLAALSIRNSLYLEYGFGGWTYVMEGRYFAFISFFIQQAVVVILYYYRSVINKWIVRLLFILVFATGIDTLHNIYFTYKITKEKNFSPRNIGSVALLDYTDLVTKKVIEENSGKKIVVISQPAHYGAQAGFYQQVPALYSFSSLRSVDLRTKEPVTILLITTNIENLPAYIIHNSTKKIVGNFNKYTFYTINLEPLTP